MYNLYGLQGVLWEPFVVRVQHDDIAVYYMCAYSLIKKSCQNNMQTDFLLNKKKKKSTNDLLIVSQK